MDVQLTDFDGALAPEDYAREPQTNEIFELQEVATGYFIGQPALQIGMYENPIVGPTEVTAWESLPVAGMGDCPVTATKGNLQTAAPGSDGDSGGPVLLEYNGTWRLAATNIGGDQFGDLHQWIGYVDATVPEITVCTSTSPC